jgi:hypothetical protein
MIKEMKLNGITVTLDTDMNGDGETSSERVSGCWLNAMPFNEVR